MKDEIKYLRSRIQFHERSIEQLRKAIAVLEAGMQDHKSTSVAEPQAEYQTESVEKKSRTVRQMILDCLGEDETPKKASDFVKYIAEARNSDYSLSTLSPQLSTFVGKWIEKLELKGRPIEDRFYYGKKEWFENGKLKAKYLKKILDDEKGKSKS